MSLKRKFKKIYDQIPSFKCIPGCTDCCGPVPFAKWEWNRVEDKKHVQGIKCPYANNGCEIYKYRPFMCRLFGTVEKKRSISIPGGTITMECPHGCGPEKKLSPKKELELTKEYLKLMKA